MVRKKIDNRIRVQIENGVTQGHRSLFVLVGDKGKDQVRTGMFRNKLCQSYLSYFDSSNFHFGSQKVDCIDLSLFLSKIRSI